MEDSGKKRKVRQILALAVFLGFMAILHLTANSEQTYCGNSGQTINGNIETILELKDDTNENKHLDTFRIVGEIESNYLQLPYTLKVEASRLDEVEPFNYNQFSHTVTLNSMFFEKQTSREVLEMVCHSARHAYQCCLVAAFDRCADPMDYSLPAFRQVAKFRVEIGFDPVFTENQTYMSTLFCKSEVDAQEYAAKRSEVYYEKINDYLNRKS